MVHQAAKLKDDEKDKYIEWLYDLEFNIYQIPKPDHIIFLDVEPEVSQELMKIELISLLVEKQRIFMKVIKSI